MFLSRPQNPSMHGRDIGGLELSTCSHSDRRPVARLLGALQRCKCPEMNLLERASITLLRRVPRRAVERDARRARSVVSTDSVPDSERFIIGDSQNSAARSNRDAVPSDSASSIGGGLRMSYRSFSGSLEVETPIEEPACGTGHARLLLADQDVHVAGGVSTSTSHTTFGRP